MLNRLYLRDVGGIPTVDGRRVRTSLLYRSSGLNPISRDDRAALAVLNLQHIVDLREHNAVRRSPDLFRANRMTHMPIKLGAFETIKYRDILLRRVDWDAMAHLRVYADILEQNGDYICQFLNLLVSDSLPMLIHCAAGKDRTGVFVAVAHLALGVARDDVVKSYMLIKPHLDQHFPSTIRWVLDKTRVPQLSHTVIADYMNGMIDHIEEKYGDIQVYLNRVGFKKTDELKKIFLD